MRARAVQTPWGAKRLLAVGFLTLALLVGGGGAWAVFTRIAGAVVAPGQIVVERNRVVVQHPEGGRVTQVFVEEGDFVARDDLLIQLDDSSLATDLVLTEVELFETMARRALARAESIKAADISFPRELDYAQRHNPDLAHQIEAHRRVLAVHKEAEAHMRDHIAKKQAQITSQIEGLRAQRAGILRQRDLIGQELASQEQLLENGLTQVGRVLALERELAQLEGRLGELSSEEASAASRVTELQIDLADLGTQRRQRAMEEERELNARITTLREQRSALQTRIARLKIYAPVAGAVYNFVPRTVITPAEEILSLVPADRELEIAARIDPVHIDETRVGQQVVLRFPSFDQSDTPTLTGIVRRLSADAFADERGRLFYRATIHLDPGALDDLPAGAALVPGMPVQAFLRTQDRTPIAYLTKPLTDYFAKAFRD